MSEWIPKRSIADRIEVLEEYVRDRDVLDLGVVDSRAARGTAEQRISRTGNMLFFKLAELNPNIVGLDLDAEGVEALKADGYNAICGDVQTVNLERQFDTIIAGEIIEHLDNPGQFLNNMRKHLKPGGHLAVSTPNPFFTKQHGKIWRHGTPQVHEEHTCWFDPITLNHSLNRAGLKTVASCWINPKGQFFKTWPCFLRPYFSHSFMIVASVQGDRIECLRLR